MRVNCRTGQLEHIHENNSYDFVMVVMDREAKRSICACGVNKQHSQVKGPKAKKEDLPEGLCS